MKYFFIFIPFFLCAQTNTHKLNQFLEYEIEKKKVNSIDKILFASDNNDSENGVSKDQIQNSSLSDLTAVSEICWNDSATYQKIKFVEKENEKVLIIAKEYLGLKYGFGKNTNRTMDCSGFTQQVYRKLGIFLPRSASKQSFFGSKIALKELKAGDLLFYSTYKSAPSHVAIYAGNGKMIHASYIARKIQYDSIDKIYYKKRFLFAKRVTQNKNNE